MKSRKMPASFDAGILFMGFVAGGEVVHLIGLTNRQGRWTRDTDAGGSDPHCLRQISLVPGLVRSCYPIVADKRASPAPESDSIFSTSGAEKLNTPPACE
jgi:hypothetical protein